MYFMYESRSICVLKSFRGYMCVSPNNTRFKDSSCNFFSLIFSVYVKLKSLNILSFCYFRYGFFSVYVEIKNFDVSILYFFYKFIADTLFLVSEFKNFRRYFFWDPFRLIFWLTDWSDGQVKYRK